MSYKPPPQFLYEITTLAQQLARAYRDLGRAQESKDSEGVSEANIVIADVAKALSDLGVII